jgi:hypothetical protein
MVQRHPCQGVISVSILQLLVKTSANHADFLTAGGGENQLLSNNKEKYANNNC